MERGSNARILRSPVPMRTPYERPPTVLVDTRSLLYGPPRPGLVGGPTPRGRRIGGETSGVSIVVSLEPPSEATSAKDSVSVLTSVSSGGHDADEELLGPSHEPARNAGDGKLGQPVPQSRETCGQCDAGWVEQADGSV